MVHFKILFTKSISNIPYPPQASDVLQILHFALEEPTLAIIWLVHSTVQMYQKLLIKWDPPGHRSYFRIPANLGRRNRIYYGGRGVGLIWKQSNYPAAASLRWAVTIGHSGFPRTSEAIGPTTAAAAWCVATRPGSFGAGRSVIVLWKECRMLEAGHGRCGLHRSRIPWGEGPCPRPQLLASHDSVGNAFVFICGGHGTIMFDRRVRRTINIDFRF